MMFRYVGTKERLVDKVVNEIQQQITEGGLAPGMMLPPERELCEQLGVSRTVLREAVRMLVTKGLLDTRPGVGTIVRQVTSEQISEPLGIMLAQTENITLDHLDDVRNILEVEIARRAARYATDEEILSLREMTDRMGAAKNLHEEFADLDTLFHRSLAEMTHNPFLVVLLDSISDLMRDVRLMVLEYINLPELVNPGHVRLVEQIATHDSEGAAEAMQDHLEQARMIQTEYLALRKGGSK